MTSEQARAGWRVGIGGVAIALALWVSGPGAQTALRLRGSATGTDGVGLAASVELEAFFGYRMAITELQRIARTDGAFACAAGLPGC